MYGRVKELLEAKFLSNVDCTGDCWLWKPHTRSPDGYGRLRLHDTNLVAHRASYEYFVGPIPKGALVRHVCHNPACVRPEHLRLGTDADNMADRKAQGGYARKLSRDQVIEIRERAAQGESSPKIARGYPVTARYIRRVVAGQGQGRPIRPWY